MTNGLLANSAPSFFSLFLSAYENVTTVGGRDWIVVVSVSAFSFKRGKYDQLTIRVCGGPITWRHHSLFRGIIKMKQTVTSSKAVQLLVKS